jgi:hypothetical protein
LNLSLTDPYHFAQALILGPEWAQRKETAHKSRYFQRKEEVLAIVQQAMHDGLHLRIMAQQEGTCGRT